MAKAQPILRFGEPFLFTEATYSMGSEFVVDGGAVTGQVVPVLETL